MTNWRMPSIRFRKLKVKELFRDLLRLYYHGDMEAYGMLGDWMADALRYNIGEINDGSSCSRDTLKVSSAPWLQVPIMAKPREPMVPFKKLRPSQEDMVLLNATG